ncbi:Aste57867_9310 [Aphanomyces stellatus]|uniref:Aste57867_9310 protein n=1 Tax=Aphanomyces stellatus TaxID=120398 RepID=A0A485KMW0_9STRA|nr:hypothetical protein As57867_009274 [Aphanomyces stellatus]VFT86192.1 Aste57867_9310 [Aphanomyces stellatus]
MDVEFDSFDDASSIATLTFTSSSSSPHEDVFLASLLSAVKIELGLPPAADVSLHVEGSKVHATLGRQGSLPRDEVPNVDLIDVFTQKRISLQDAMWTTPNAILAIWSAATKVSVLEVQQHALQLLDRRDSSTQILVLHTGASPQEALDSIVLDKLFFPQQTMHHYHLPAASVEKLVQALSLPPPPTTASFVLCDKKRHIVAQSNTFSTLDVSGTSVLPPPPAPPLVHTTHDACDGLLYPNVQVVHLPTMETIHLFDCLDGDALTVLDFWSTTCVRCPAAIATLLHHYRTSSVNAKIQYVLINTDNAQTGWGLVQTNHWLPHGDIVHLYVTLPVKEALKRFMAMKQMPHHVLLDTSRHVVCNGKFFSYATVDEALAARQPPSVQAVAPTQPPTPPPVAAPAHTFVLDDDF